MLGVCRTIGVLMLVLVSVGCEDAPRKTDSMIFRERAQKQAQVFVDKAHGLMDQDVRDHPMDHLPQWNIVADAVSDARGIYERREIANWQHPQLKALENELDNLQPQLRAFSEAKLLELVDRTLILRQLIEEAKTLPYSRRDASTDGLVKMLDARYNQEILACCLEPLGYADHLMLRDLENNKALIRLIRSIHGELENIIRDDAYADTLKQRIQEALP